MDKLKKNFLQNLRKFPEMKKWKLFQKTSRGFAREIPKPHQGTIRPHEGTVRPHEGTTRPHEGTARPHEGTIIPHEGTARPHEGTQTT